MVAKDEDPALSSDNLVLSARTRLVRRSAVLAWGGLLTAAAVVACVRQPDRAVWPDEEGSFVLVSASAVLGTSKNKADVWNERSIAAVKKIFQENPAFIKNWAQLTGSSGKLLLAKLSGAAKQPSRGHRFGQLDRDMQQLEDSVTNLTAEASGSSEGTPDVEPNLNSRAAFLMINDLSDDWDAHSNYSTTPWEFCAGRYLSNRQLRECAQHLMSAAGVPAHRDLELDSKVFDRMCSSSGHHYIDKRGNVYPLPRGTKAVCAAAVTARNNVNQLMKRQISLPHPEVVAGALVPPPAEMDGSHGVPCDLIPEGCR